jgi:AcrR family transcriptional regulator
MANSTALARAEPSGRLALVIAAERLFAERGVNGVSLRQINEAAGQRNASAAHYHFGSRDGVVRAVIEHRMSVVDARRRALVDRLREEGRMGDPRALVGAWVRPLAAELAPRPEGNYYIRFLEQATRVWSNLPPNILQGLDNGWQQAGDALKQLLGYLPREVVRLRVVVATQHCVAALAQLEAQLTQAETDAAVLDLQVENLIDMLLAGLTAPVSGETQAALREHRPGMDGLPGPRAGGKLRGSARSDHEQQQSDLSDRGHRRRRHRQGGDA